LLIGFKDFILKSVGFYISFFFEKKLDIVKVGEQEKISSDY